LKLVRLSTVYPVYKKQFYERRPGLEDKTCAQQEEALFYDAFGWADFWKEALEPLGYEVEEVVANAEPVQRAWAKERGLEHLGKDWLHQIAVKRIEDFQPDILFINDYLTFNRSWIEGMRSRCPSIRLVLGWCGAPFPDPDVFRGYDLVLSCVPELVEKFRDMGHEARHLNHAFDSRVLDKIDTENDDSFDFTFVGQVHRQAGFHLEREELLLHLVDKTPLEIFSMSHHVPTGRYLRAFAWKGIQSVHQSMKILGFSDGFLERIPVISRGPQYRDYPFLPIHPGLRGHLRPPVFGLGMFQTLRDSAVTFNSHLSISTHSASNMRMFETTGVGSCLLTDHMDQMAKLFEPGKEVVTYSSPEECVEKALYLLENRNESAAIARSGQERTLADHTFHNRAPELDAFIRQGLGKKGR
jgi:spore maturation protein CgeB